MIAEAVLGADPYEWERTKRLTVNNSPRRARYPSITKAVDGSLLVLFTRQSAEQETVDQGELVWVRSTDKGETWSKAVSVFRGGKGVPRAVGTMVTLKSGRIIAPFAELGEAQATSKVHLLSSGDNGKNWQVSEVKAKIPLAWWAPCGKVMETARGTLVMMVFGAKSTADLKATIHSCGLLRSRDGGKTWRDYSTIAPGGETMIGAAPGRRFSFEGPSVVALLDGHWLAMVTARRLNKEGTGPSPTNEGPGSPLVLCRLWSKDKGRTWTKPDQLTPGAWPTLAVMGGHTLCVNTQWAAWGWMGLEVSRNGFQTIFQEARIMIRGWVRGWGNNPKEVPLPPTVPYLSGDWSFEHYGFPSALALDKDNLILVFGRTQRGTGAYHFDPDAWNNIPWERERITAVFFRRVPIKVKLAAPMKEPVRRPHGRWVLAERIVIPDLGHSMIQLANGDLFATAADGKTLRRSPDGGRTWQVIAGVQLPGHGPFAVLRNGRWLVANIHVYKDWITTGGESTISEVVDMRNGYPLVKNSGNSYDCAVVVSYSDDKGRTWTAGEPFKGPFLWTLPTAPHFIEGPDGTVSLPIFGCVTEEEMDSYSSSNGVIRSTDGGETWGDFSFVFRTQPKGPDDLQAEPRLTEMDIVDLPNGHWVAFSRNEYETHGPRAGGTRCALSTDFGRTWKPTGGVLAGVSQQRGIALPDGGIALCYRSHSWQQPGVAITYDEGRSFDYMLAGPYETINAAMHGDDEFVFFTIPSHRSDSTAGVYRWVPEPSAK